jgi:hypothetical protein
VRAALALLLRWRGAAAADAGSPLLLRGRPLLLRPALVLRPRAKRSQTLRRRGDRGTLSLLSLGLWGGLLLLLAADERRRPPPSFVAARGGRRAGPAETRLPAHRLERSPTRT